MSKKKAPSSTKRIPAAVKEKKRNPAPDIAKHQPPGPSAVPNTMTDTALGAGAAAERSSKGGKSGGGMGGQQAGGIKGGGKRKTHAGRK